MMKTKTTKKGNETFPFSLSKADSNHHKQNQNLLCYHYTIGHRFSKFGCKGKKYLANRQIFLHLFVI